MRYRCEILNHRIDCYEVWIHGHNQGRAGVKEIFMPQTGQIVLLHGHITSQIFSAIHNLYINFNLKLITSRARKCQNELKFLINIT